MISQIAEAISAFFYSMDVIDEEEKGKSRYGIESIISEIAKCAFILWAVISVYQSLSMIISN